MGSWTPRSEQNSFNVAELIGKHGSPPVRSCGLIFGISTSKYTPTQLFFGIPKNSEPFLDDWQNELWECVSWVLKGRGSGDKAPLINVSPRW